MGDRYDFIVRVISKRRIKQRFHIVLIDGGNYEPLFTSENLGDKAYANLAAQKLADAFKEELNVRLELAS